MKTDQILLTKNPSILTHSNSLLLHRTMKFKRKTFSRLVVSSSPSKRLATPATARQWTSTQRTKKSKKEVIVQTRSSQIQMMKNGKSSNRFQPSWRLTRKIQRRSVGSAGFQEPPLKILFSALVNAQVQ